MTSTRSTLRRTLGATALAAVIALSAASCGNNSRPSDPEPASGSVSPSATESASPSASPSETQAQSGTNAPAEEPISPINGDQWTRKAFNQEAVYTEEGGLVFTDMRVAEHPDFYRVVIELQGANEPGWFMSWSDKPVEQGRGLPLNVTGVSYLDLRITGTTMPVLEGQQAIYYGGPNSLTAGPINVVEDGTFEDQTHIVIGMDEVRDFQVGTLTNPTRVVIDIKK